jgi:hypothetical protein
MEAAQGRRAPVFIVPDLKLTARRHDRRLSRAGPVTPGKGP